MGSSERYSYSLTTFSPSGKLAQIEYALSAVVKGGPSVGAKVKSGVVIASEKKQNSILYDEKTVSKIERITDHIGMTYSGMGPDFRLLVSEARRMAVRYKIQYGEPIPTVQLVKELAGIMQEYTQSGGVRPFGVSLLVIGYDEGKPYLFQCDPSGVYISWHSTAIGKNYINARTFLQKRFDEEQELDDAVHTAVLTLKESFEGQMTEDNIEIGICNKDGFTKMPTDMIRDVIAMINE